MNDNAHCLYADGIHDDTAALQRLLDSGKHTIHIPDGVYLISGSLILHDDTHLILSPGAVIRLADHADCFMLKNDLCGKAGRNRRISVEGGTWDGNNLHQERGKTYEDKPYFMGVVMRFEGIEDLLIRDITVKDPESYAMQIIDADRFTVENISFDFNMLRPNMDGVHVQGPARNGIIRSIRGATNDDLVALNCDDRYDDGYQSTVSQGDIENISIDGLYADNGYTAVRLLSCGSRMQNISIRNIFGTYRFYGVSFTHHGIVPGAPVWFDGITIDNVFCSKHPQLPPVDPKFIEGVDRCYGEGCHDSAIRHAPIIWFAEGITCGSISLSNIHRCEAAVTEAPTIQIDKDVSIERLSAGNLFQRFLNCPEAPLLRSEGCIGRLICPTGEIDPVCHPS